MLNVRGKRWVRYNIPQQVRSLERTRPASYSVSRRHQAVVEYIYIALKLMDRRDLYTLATTRSNETVYATVDRIYSLHGILFKSTSVETIQECGVWGKLHRFKKISLLYLKCATPTEARLRRESCTWLWCPSTHFESTRCGWLRCIHIHKSSITDALGSNQPTQQIMIPVPTTTLYIPVDHYYSVHKK